MATPAGMVRNPLLMRNVWSAVTSLFSEPMVRSLIKVTAGAPVLGAVAVVAGKVVVTGVPKTGTALLPPPPPPPPIRPEIVPPPPDEAAAVLQAVAEGLKVAVPAAEASMVVVRTTEAHSVTTGCAGDMDETLISGADTEKCDPIAKG